MSKSKVIRNSLVSVALAAVVGLAAVSTFSVSTAKADVPETEETIATTYFKDQLVPGSASVGIYETLEDMYLGGDLLSGTKTVDLVETGVLENRSYSQSVLTAEFSAGRDAFFMDYSSVFYTDGDLLTLRELTNSTGDYSITMGIGREETYFSDGF
ncbi:MAG: hypothetical protein LUD47_05520, partial [Clostridia bacterium]|nr:hypothetical protein [Clostridia bacterium]